jgi:CzcA family heavy metal efflux pump
MLNKVIQYSLTNRLLVLFLVCIATGVGLWTAQTMEVDVFPDLNAPTVVVMTEAAGMATEEVEKTVTLTIETALNGATDVRRVRSSSTTGFSVVWVEFDWGTDIYLARQIVAEKLSAVGETLPQSVGQPVLAPQSSILGEMMILGITADETSQQELRTIADWTIRPRLLSTGGVAQVAVIGGDIKEYQVLMSPAKMCNLGVSMDEVLSATRGMSLNSAGGVLYEYGNEYIIRGVTATTDVEKLAQAFVKITASGQPVTLADVATVKIGNHSPRLGLASERGKPAVLVTVTKQPQTNTIELTERIEQAVSELQATLPSDVNISTDIFRQSRFIEASIHNIQDALLEGALFVLIVLALFLANWRVTTISLVALPVSVLVTLVVLRAFGMTINTMSLGGIAIAIGSLVDDAIIDVDNVYRRLRENRLKPVAERASAMKIIYDGSVEIRSSIINATVITIVAFVPLFFLTGMEGRMLRPLGVAFIVSLVVSMIVAMTLTPAMCSWMLTGEKQLKKSEREAPVSRWMKRIYRPALDWVLGHKAWVLGSLAVLFVGAGVVFTTFGSGFLPPFNEGSLTINVGTMPGISLEESDRMGRMVEEILLEVPEIQTVARKTGRAELDEHALGVNASELEAPFVLSGRTRAEFMADVRQRLSVLAGLDIEVGQPISHRIDAMLSGTEADIAIKLFGEDLNRMYTLGNQIKSAITDIDGVADVTVEQQVERPQLQIVPRREMLARHGISMPEFSEFVGVALAGEVVSEVYDGSAMFPLTVKMDEASRSNIESIGNLLIDGANGVKVPLSQVADVVSVTGPNTINRENVQRRIVVSANVPSGDLGGAVEAIKEAVAENVTLPEGYYIQYGGAFESRASAVRTLTFATLIAILVIFLILFTEFRRVSLSLMIMVTMPLAMIGGVAAVWLSSGIVSIPAIIGFISLLGISVRNGILLVSHYGTLRAGGMSLHQSVVQGSLDRLNPILMTCLTSALALIPLALGADVSGNEIQSPMAKVILGGLVSSLILNMAVVPALYVMLNQKMKNENNS